MNDRTEYIPSAEDKEKLTEAITELLRDAEWKDLKCVYLYLVG